VITLTYLLLTVSTGSLFLITLVLMHNYHAISMRHSFGALRASVGLKVMCSEGHFLFTFHLL